MALLIVRIVRLREVDYRNAIMAEMSALTRPSRGGHVVKKFLYTAIDARVRKWSFYGIAARLRRNRKHFGLEQNWVGIEKKPI